MSPPVRLLAFGCSGPCTGTSRGSACAQLGGVVGSMAHPHSATAGALAFASPKSALAIAPRTYPPRVSRRAGFKSRCT